MERKKIIDDIIEQLTFLKIVINTYTGAGLYDVAIYGEDLFQQLLNLIFNYKLTNANLLEKKNYPAIDLSDKDNGICFQITADSSSKKVEKTISEYIDKELYKTYQILKFLILKKKVNHSKTSFETQGLFSFDKVNDILYIDDLIIPIRSKTIDDLKKIQDFLRKEVSSKKKEATETIAKEVETIIDLIEFLSANVTNIDDPIEEPDPEKKIYKRFSAHTDFLINQIKEYIPMYANARKEAVDKIGLDALRIKYITLYLKAKSDSMLTEANGNPEVALNNLVGFFEEQLSKTGKKYDYNAIRYFLIQEIINCNVFPNEYKIKEVTYPL